MTIETHPRCNAHPPELMVPCVLAAGHEGRHIDRADSGCWASLVLSNDQDHPWLCVRERAHTGPHVTPGGRRDVIAYTDEDTHERTQMRRYVGERAMAQLESEFPGASNDALRGVIHNRVIAGQVLRYDPLARGYVAASPVQVRLGAGPQPPLPGPGQS